MICQYKRPVHRFPGSACDRSHLGEEDLDGVHWSSGPQVTAVTYARRPPQRPPVYRLSGSPVQLFARSFWTPLAISGPAETMVVSFSMVSAERM